MRRWLLFSILLLAAVLAGCNKEAPDAADGGVSAAPGNAFWEPTAAQPKLPTMKLRIGSEELITEIARSDREQQTGMMFRREMAENEAMIFIFPTPRRASFWMKNCYVPLSVAYLDSQGVIQEIHDMYPHAINSVVSQVEDVRFALEVPQGWFSRHNVTPGMTVRSERGSLMETFEMKQ